MALQGGSPVPPRGKDLPLLGSLGADRPDDRGRPFRRPLPGTSHRLPLLPGERRRAGGAGSRRPPAGAGGGGGYPVPALECGDRRQLRGRGKEVTGRGRLDSDRHGAGRFGPSRALPAAPGPVALPPGAPGRAAGGGVSPAGDGAGRGATLPLLAGGRGADLPDRGPRRAGRGGLGRRSRTSRGPTLPRGASIRPAIACPGRGATASTGCGPCPGRIFRRYRPWRPAGRTACSACTGGRRRGRATR